MPDKSKANESTPLEASSKSLTPDPVSSKTGEQPEQAAGQADTPAPQPTPAAKVESQPATVGASSEQASKGASPSSPSSSGEASSQQAPSAPPVTPLAPLPEGTAQVEPTSVAQEAPAAQPDSSTPAPRAKPRDLYRALGLSVVAAGFGLAVAPLVSWQVSQVLQPLGNPLVPAGTLIVSGLVLFGIGVLRRTLGAVHTEVEYIANETPMLGQIASHGRQLQKEFGDVESALGASREDMQTLQGFVAQLMELATNPEFEVSLFRMAASLDQLGARLDVSMKDRFTSVQEHLDGLEQKTQSSTKDLTSGLESLEQRLQEQDTTWRENERESREEISKRITEVGAEFGRLEGAVAKDLQEQLGDLRDQIATTLRTASDLSGERLDHCSESMSEISGGFGKLESAIAEDVDQRLTDLREQLAETWAASTTRSGDQLEQCMKAVAGLSLELGQIQSAMIEGVTGLSSEASQAAQQVTSELGDLNQQLLQAVEGQGSSLAGQIKDLEGALSARTSESPDWSAALDAHAERHSAELGEQLEGHRAQVEQTISQRCDALANDLTAMAELVCESNTAVQTVQTQDAPATIENRPAPVAQTEADCEGPLKPRGALPFGHDVHGQVAGSTLTRSGSEIDADEPSVQGPLPGQEKPQAAQPEAFDYPIERLGREFGDGWTDG